MESNQYNPAIYNDYGPNPVVIDIDGVSEQNTMFRTTLWTGTHLQLTLMSLEPGEDIGLEVHPELDQFLRIEEGTGHVMMGDTKEDLPLQADVNNDYAIIVPAGTWHNLINTGTTPLKLYSIYSPLAHPMGTIHETKEIAEQNE